MRRFIASVLLAIISMVSVATVANAAPDTPGTPDVVTEVELADKATTPERPTHSTITASAYNVCAWVGVRDGVLGIGDTSLVNYYNFWYVDHTWVYCKVKIRLSTSVRCHAYIVSRHDGHTIHLGDTSCST